MNYLLPLLISFFISILATVAVRAIASRFKIVDRPGERKIHHQEIPLMGGLAVFTAFFATLFIFSGRFLAGNLEWRHLLGFFIGAVLIIGGGIIDDKYNLSPRYQIVFPLLAVAAVIIGGVEIEKISNPLGGYIYLRDFIYLGYLLIAFWLLGMMYTTKLLDGVDGLVSGIGAIGGLVIFLFTITTRYYQPDIALAALIFTGAALGFLVFNFHPAKIFLGEGGSLFVGFVLGVLAIISGGKIAIALLVMGIPILDVAWTIIRRLAQGRNPFKFSDNKHLHHRLLALGLGQRRTVLVFYVLSLLFGLSGLFLQSRGKAWALLILLIIMAALVIFFRRLDSQPEGKRRPSLLLQICCAPCGAYVTKERLQSKYEVTWFFYNPNLDSQAEYDRRLDAVRLAAERYQISLIAVPYEHEKWRAMTAGRECDPEKGARCQLCYRERLATTARLAKEKGFAYFGTTLSVSPYKDAAAIKNIGEQLARSTGVAFLPDDLQADDAYRRSQEFAKAEGYYRQKYCGCEYSYRPDKKPAAQR